MQQPSSGSASSAYASIMVPMDLDPAAERRARVAAGLADRFSSRLIGIAAQPVVAPLYFEAPSPGVVSITELEERRAVEEMAKAEAMFRRAVGNRTAVEWRQALTGPLEHALNQARAADLIVAARPDRRALGPMDIDAGDLVMDAGRPVLFVPPEVDQLSAQRIAIGWKDSREARRAVWDALPLLKSANEVVVITVGDDGKATKDVVEYLVRHGVEASARTLSHPSRAAGDELLHVAEQELADLIVCGAYGHNRAREWILGGVTRDLLDHSSLCCLMAH
jgi:nucleotide-binding universal stress UspA family protein